jgi:rhodanese-related sulfurtransferase
VPAWLAARPNALVPDAREAPQHAQDPLAGSLRLDGQNHEILLLCQRRDRPVFLHCYYGKASQSYAQMFVAFGFCEGCDLIGGWKAWRQAALEAWQQTTITALQQAAIGAKKPTMQSVRNLEAQETAPFPR